MAAYRQVYGFGLVTAEDRDQLQNPLLTSSMGLPSFSVVHTICLYEWYCNMLKLHADIVLMELYVDDVGQW